MKQDVEAAEKEVRMARAKSVREIVSKKFATLPFDGDWLKAFARPEPCGVWFVWGNSGNGKTNFAMQLCRELCKYGKVVYDSLEEGNSLTMQQTLIRHGMQNLPAGKMTVVCEPVDVLSSRLSAKRSPDFVVIDSFQRAQLTYKKFIEFTEKHPDKMLIFISQGRGRNPLGKPAISAMFDAAQKIYVEGFRAFARSRFVGPRGYYDVWPEKAEKYWSDPKNQAKL